MLQADCDRLLPTHQDFCPFPKLSGTVIFLKPQEESICDMASGPVFEGDCWEGYSTAHHYNMNVKSLTGQVSGAKQKKKKKVNCLELEVPWYKNKHHGTSIVSATGTDGKTSLISLPKILGNHTIPESFLSGLQSPLLLWASYTACRHENKP